MALTPGARLGHYEILGLLGAGGMGEVYRARDGRLGREVALKVLPGDYAGDPDRLNRFEREAHLLASLNHPNIATLHGRDEADGVCFLVMELVPGPTLEQRLAQGRLPLAEALAVCRQVAEALEAAHERGVVHRDLKPANIKITPAGQVKVLDFGLAKSIEGLFRPAQADPGATQDYQGHTTEGMIVGTPAYMSPEQARGKPIDRRCDVWAFGCVLYEAITGRPTFAGETFSDTLAAVIERSPDWSALPPDVPPRIVEVVRRCLQKDSRRRLRDVGDARLEIEEALAEPAPGPAARRRLAPLLVALLAGLAALPVGMWLQGCRQPASPTAGPAAGADWSGELLLGSTTCAFGPRVSPDGHWLAFVVLHEGQSQVARMRLNSGEWCVLSRDRRRGLVSSLCWSADSERIYYDRFLDVPVGVYSISPLEVLPPGARDRPVLGASECPQALPDGSLVVNRMGPGSDLQIWRHWPGGEKEPRQVLAHAVAYHIGGEDAWSPSPLRTLRRANKAVFCGKLLGTEADPPRRLYLLDLDTGTTTPLLPDPMPSELRALAVAPDDRHVYTVVPAGNLYQVVQIPLTGEGRPRAVLTLTSPVYGLDVDRDGRLYLDQFRRPLEVLRFAAEGGVPERLASLARGRPLQPVDLPGGGVLLPSTVLGRDRLLLALPRREPAPLLEERVETRPPATRVGPDRLAFVAGPEQDPRVTLARLEADQVRIERRRAGVPAAGLAALAASPDGKVIYYVRGKGVWAVPADGGGAPRRLAAGDGVAVHPNGKELLVQRFENKGVRLFRVPAEGGAARAVEVRGPLRLVPDVIGGRAIEGSRVLVAAASPADWFWRTALLDLETGKLAPIPVEFEGDIYPANWGSDGKVLGMAYPLKSDLWRFTQR
jgi:hypothetical protein